jgi:hypothetical protein
MKRLEVLGILYWVFGGLNLAGALLSRWWACSAASD